ncbi:MAG: hypothetical protein FWD35_00730 [Oscillospiraceae bacterium]|nr:hypothetical protein [Oscillospiraceae bacterium]
MKNKDDTSNIPDSKLGHRERMKARFKEMDSAVLHHLPEYEPLEFLLFFARERIDTEKIARDLIARFGSLTAVLNASYDELLKVKGVGPHTASLIYYARIFSEFYMKNQTRGLLDELFNSERLKDYCQALFMDAHSEEIHCLYMDNNLKLLACERVCVGTLGKVEIPVRQIARSIIARNCSRIVIAHNHPTGTCMPSRVDIDTTKQLRAAFAQLETELLDHIVVGRDGAISMAQNKFAGW